VRVSLPGLSPLLIANRGEIAVRVAATARALGVRTIAVYTAADEGAPHTTVTDAAVRVESYLDADAIVEAAVAAGARSVHPGYGFLSENAGFAERIGAAEITWVGPPPEAIRVMGDKGEAKQLAAGADVPIVPGTPGVEADASAIEALAREHGLPIVIKALAGGGGKGMRVVTDESHLEAAIAAARREAESAFGDGRVMAERYLERPRHIEIQVLADAHGNVVHLVERECSLQRRHQKVIEEAPSPAIDSGQRDRMGAAAVSLAKACGYVGAGTVEFIVGADGFYFLEMNTRLQVEHPVTELVWGVDLVEQQLRVAAGETLALDQASLVPHGHAVEARLYAEDPAAGFLPATGSILRLRVPEGEGIRFDSGIREGGVVGTDFDPMLAKLIAHGRDRDEAIERLDGALAQLELLGVAHNGGFSRDLLALEEVRAGALDTGLLERALDGELGVDGRPADLALAGAMGFWLEDTAHLTISPGPWRRRFDELGEVRIADGAVAMLEDGPESRPASARPAPGGRIAVEVGGIERTYAYARDGHSVWIGREGYVRRLALGRQSLTDAGAGEGSLEAPMPGKVLSVEVANGDLVAAGDVLLILESMKMELQITAPQDGAVSGLSLTPGEQVAQGQALVAVAAEGEGA
jgi:acetyl-CoA/propionyl-CoA carboxylase biotin carboxyl carrier protein